MNEYLLILKMIASQEPRYEDYEFFPETAAERFVRFVSG